MPRNSSGTYAQPANTVAVSDEPIGSVAFNTLETDIGSEITNSVDRLGRGTMEANLNLGGNLINAVAAGVLSTDAANVGQLSAFPFFDAIGGLEVSNDASTPNTTINVAPGAAADATNSVTIRQSSIWKKTTGAWVAGSGNGMLDTGTVGASLWYHIYQIFNPTTKANDLLGSLSLLTLGAPSLPVVTISVASPAVVTSLVPLGLQVGACFQFNTTGALPSGVTAATNYFVTSVPTPTTFNFSATQGGSAINSTGSQSGVQTLTFSPILPAGFTEARMIWSIETDTFANILPFTQNLDECSWATPVNDQPLATVTATPGALALGSTPPGFPVKALIRVTLTKALATPNGIVYPVSESGTTAPTSGPNYNIIVPASGATGVAELNVRTNNGQQVMAAASSGGCAMNIVTAGFIHPRGRH